MLGLRGVVHVVGGADVLHGSVLAALLRPEERAAPSPCRGLGRRLRCCSFCQAPQVPEGPAHALGGDGDLLRSHCCRLLWPVLRHAPPPARAAPPQLGAEDLHRSRSAAAARDGRRALTVVRQPGRPRRSSALAHPGQVLVRGLGGSAEAFHWNRPQRSMLQRLRVGVLAGLREVVQVEVARDERGGLALRLVQGQRLISVILDRMSSPRLPNTRLALASWGQRK